MDSTNPEPKPRIRRVDWRRAIQELDASPQGASVYVGILDQSVRTHINKGRYSYIDPRRYAAYTRSVDGSRTKAYIYLYRTGDEINIGKQMGEHSQ
jgi:hypothetical protein